MGTAASADGGGGGGGGGGSNGGGDGDARQHKCLEMQKSKSEIYGAKR